MTPNELKQKLSKRVKTLQKRLVDLNQGHENPLPLIKSDQVSKSVNAEFNGELLLNNLEAKTQQEIQQLLDAISRIENHRYGVCSACGAQIPEDKLFVFPTTTKCNVCEE